MMGRLKENLWHWREILVLERFVLFTDKIDSQTVLKCLLFERFD
jgi:hypothetical protein